VLVSFESKLVDQYAGTLIAQESGVEVVDFQGEPYHTNAKRILATNPHLKAQMINLLRDYAK
jgi:fructose-1,6-bisphosphatase/inositol monophosphatase family enzyme